MKTFPFEDAFVVQGDGRFGEPALPTVVGRRCQRRRGFPRPVDSAGALVVVLLVMIFSGALLAGWLAMHSAQTTYIDMLDEASMRRIAVENASAVARQYLLNHVVTGSGNWVAISHSLAGGWGTVTVAETSGTPLHAEGKAAGWNHFNWGSGDGYSHDIDVDISVTLPLSEGWKDRYAVASPEPLTMTKLFSIKSRSPVLGGDLFIGNNPGDVSASSSVSGAVTVNGRGVIWMPDSPNTYSLVMSTFTTRTTPTADLSVEFSNFPFPPVTSGVIGGAASYDGRIDVVANGTGTNSLAHKASDSVISPIDGVVGMSEDGIECDGAGLVEIDLLEPSLGNLTINNNVQTIILEGQVSDDDFNLAGTYRSMLVVVNETVGDTLTTIQMTQRNNRKIVVAVKKASGNTTTFDVPQAAGGAWPWRGVFTLESTPSAWVVPSGATLALYGGIQTNRAISVVGGGMSIHLEPEPRLLERLTARDAWVEAYVED